MTHLDECVEIYKTAINATKKERDPRAGCDFLHNKPRSVNDIGVLRLSIAQGVRKLRRRLDLY